MTCQTTEVPQSLEQTVKKVEGRDEADELHIIEDKI